MCFGIKDQENYNYSKKPSVWPHKMNKCWIIVFVILHFAGLSFAQTAEFSFPETVCLEQSVQFENSSTDADNYQWDFCLNDLNSPAALATTATTVSSSVTPTAVVTVYDQGNWYAFVSSRDNNKLFRVDFGNSLDNQVLPEQVTEVVFDDQSAVFNGPKVMRFVQEAGVWYALGVNTYGNTLFRLSFPSGIEATPEGTLIGNLGGWSGPEGLDVVFDGTNWIAAVASWNNTVSLVNFGSTITNAPTAGDVLPIVSGEIANPYGVKLIADAGSWYGVVSSYTPKTLVRLSFGTDLFSVPARENIYTTASSPTALSIQKEGDVFYAFAATSSGSLHRLNFGDSMENDLVAGDELGSFGNLDKTEGFDLIRSSPGWFGVFINYSSKALLRLKFQGNCTGQSVSSSQESSPTVVFSAAGNYPVELTAIDESGNTDVEIQFVNVLGQSAPDISFQKDENTCVDVENNFLAISEQGGIESYSWNFDDGTEVVTNEDQISHTFAVSGAFDVTVTITSDDGCTRTASEQINIHTSPVADFELPATPYCTNEPLTFTNESVFDDDSSPQWKWYVNDIEVSAEKDLEYSFESTEEYHVKLQATIPGCASEKTESINSLAAGPSVSFDYTNNCYQEPVEFINESDTDGVISNVWDFDDGSTPVNSVDSQHEFDLPGFYEVKLTVSNAQCSNTTVIPITVTDLPLADFDYTKLTENVGATFTAEDLTQEDDEIEVWLWDIEEIGNREGSSVALTFSSPGSYLVSLTVNTVQGCDFNVSKTVDVTQSVIPLIQLPSVIPACLDENIHVPNNTVNASDQLWDFCLDDLNHPQTSAPLVGVIENAAVPTALVTVFDRGNWHGFVSSRENDKLFRIDFGASLQNAVDTEQIHEVTFPDQDNIFNGPKLTSFVYEDGVWYGIGVNVFNSTLFRLDFSSGVDQQPVAELIGNLAGWTGSEGLHVVNDGSRWIAGITSGNNKVSLVNFGNSIQNTPTPSDVLTIVDGGINFPYGIELMEEDGQWFGIVGSYSQNKIVRLKFGSDLFTVPQSDDLYSLVNPTAVHIRKEGNTYYAFAATRGGELHQLNFGNSLNNSIQSTDNFGTFGSLDKIEGFDLVKSAPYWYGLFVNANLNTVSMLQFKGPCEDTSDERRPLLSFDTPGEYPIELTAYHNNGNATSETSTVVISENNAPSIQFDISQNRCLGFLNTFSAVEGMVNYSWDFGSETSETTQSAITYTYPTVGEKTIQLSIQATNGCHNYLSKNIPIFNIPQAQFDLPVANSPCTNQDYEFENATTSDPGSNPTWEWFVDGASQTETEKLNTSFSSLGEHKIKLIAKIPGCQTVIEKTFSTGE